uniref:Putative secreted protein n=1 Tax=Ixodes ricinus TaxID=34613 RepID=A0A6B0UAC0_IXORI
MNIVAIKFELCLRLLSFFLSFFSRNGGLGQFYKYEQLDSIIIFLTTKCAIQACEKQASLALCLHTPKAIGALTTQMAVKAPPVWEQQYFGRKQRERLWLQWKSESTVH